MLPMDSSQTVEMDSVSDYATMLASRDTILVRPYVILSYRALIAATGYTLGLVGRCRIVTPSTHSVYLPVTRSPHSTVEHTQGQRGPSEGVCQALRCRQVLIESVRHK